MLLCFVLIWQTNNIHVLKLFFFIFNLIIIISAYSFCVKYVFSNYIKKIMYQYFFLFFLSFPIRIWKRLWKCRTHHSILNLCLLYSNTLCSLHICHWLWTLILSGSPFRQLAYHHFWLMPKDRSLPEIQKW